MNQNKQLEHPLSYLFPLIIEAFLFFIEKLTNIVRASRPPNEKEQQHIGISSLIINDNVSASIGYILYKYFRKYL